MKFPKAGELRVKTYIDYEGDYVAKVELYRSFWSGWCHLDSFYAVRGRTPEEAIRLAQQKADSLTGLELGVIQ